MDKSADGLHRVTVERLSQVETVRNPDLFPTPSPKPVTLSTDDWPDGPTDVPIAKKVFINRPDVQQALVMPRANGICLNFATSASPIRSNSTGRSTLACASSGMKSTLPMLYAGAVGVH